MIEVRFGNAIPIVATLFDGDATKFLRAKVYDGLYNQVTGSPFTLTSIGSGSYKNEGFTPSAEGIFIAVVEVFNDDLFAEKSIDYSLGEEYYLITDREDRLEDIDANIDSNEGKIA